MKTILSGFPFIFDKVASERYNAYIVSINNNNYAKPSGSGVEFITDTISKNPEVLFLGARQSPVLSFPIEIACDDKVDIYKFIRMKDWIFDSSSGFKKLQICADNLNKFYFNCRLIAGDDYIFNDGYQAISCIVECDAPWAWENIKTKRYTKQQLFDLGNIFEFNNISADSTDMKPIIEFTMSTGSYNFKMINKSYENRTFEWTGLQGGETMIVDNKNEIISSSTGLRRLKNFNKKFFRFKKGKNIIECMGSIEELKITYKNAHRLGGGFR